MSKLSMREKNNMWIYASIMVLFFITIGAYVVVLKLSPVIRSTHKLQVITSFYPLYFFASQIGGDKSDVYNITPFGVEPHDYEPTLRDITLIEKSNLLILNGGNFESWGKRISENMQNTKTNVVIAGENAINSKLDPHVWLSPPLAQIEVKAILQSFIQIDPNNRQYYEKNAHTLLLHIQELDKEYKSGLLHCKQNDIITSHSAFSYLAETYALHQLSISGLSPDEEPSPRQLAEVAQFARKHNTKYIFFEKLVSTKLAETIANEIGATTLVLDPIEGLSHNDITSGKNYLTLMKDNLTHLQLALECK